MRRSDRRNIRKARRQWGAESRWREQLAMGEIWGTPEATNDVFERFVVPHCPAGARVLELAPGAGRFTRLLATRTDRLVLVDLNPVCLDLTRAALAEAGWAGTLETHTTDGSSLPVPDRSVDFAACFDSMVHFTSGIVERYLLELARALVPGGYAFLHHAGEGETGVGWRSDVTRRAFARMAGAADLSLVVQEPWYPLPDGRFNDALSLVRAPGGDR